MAAVNLTIDGKPVSAPEDATILEAARQADIYIPTLCHHPDLPSAKGKTPAEAVFHGPDRIENNSEQELSGCGLCVVEVGGRPEPVQACITQVQEGLVVTTDSESLKKIRQEKLIPRAGPRRPARNGYSRCKGCSRAQTGAPRPEPAAWWAASAAYRLIYPHSSPRPATRSC